MSLVSAAKDFLGLGDQTFNTMTTPDKATFVSPTGKRIPFDFEDISSSYDKKASVFESAVGDGTYVQDNGHTSGRFPIAAIFYGDGYEKRSEAFFSAVLEPGVGLLSHPQYNKPIDVVSVGTIDRLDAYVTGSNQTIFVVTFYETTGLKIGQVGGLGQSFDSFIDASAADFANGVNLGAVSDAQAFIQRVKARMKQVESAMKTGVKGLAKVTQKVQDIGDSINRGIDTLVGSPLTMAYQIQMLMLEPARQIDRFEANLKAYGDLAAFIFGGELFEKSDYSIVGINDFHLDKLLGQLCVANSAKLADDAADRFPTKSAYIAHAESLRDLLEDLQTWNDDNFQNIEGGLISNSNIDIGIGMKDLHDLIAKANTNLLTRSFDAKNKMSMVLSAERTIIDLVYELYGSMAYDVQDEFIRLNKLSGDEYLLLGKGRKVEWYL